MEAKKSSGGSDPFNYSKWDSVVDTCLLALGLGGFVPALILLLLLLATSIITSDILIITSGILSIICNVLIIDIREEGRACGVLQESRNGLWWSV